MDIHSLIDKLNDMKDELKNQKIDTNSFFTENEHFNDDLSISEPFDELDNTNYDMSVDKEVDDSKKLNNEIPNNFSDIQPNIEVVSIATVNENRLLTAQAMFKKSIRISLKSFLISISLSFLNLFI